MTQDEIIEMARQAGFGKRYEGRGQISSAPATTEKLEAFAKLVDAKATAREREACAKVCDKASAVSLPAFLAMQIRARGESTSIGEA